MILGYVRRLRNGVNKHFARRILPLALRTRATLCMEAVGDGDGAWVVPVDLIRPGWVCYCFGVGLNATFDVALAERFGCRVYSFDPTPRSIEYMGDLNPKPHSLTFLPIGVWKEEADLKFYAPMNTAHCNYSVSDIHGTGQFFIAKCRRLSTIMNEMGHSRIDLLKLDIEGSWYEVLTNILSEQIEVSVLCVEFDTPTSTGKILRMVRAIERSGMVLAYRERENYSFVKQTLLVATVVDAPINT